MESLEKLANESCRIVSMIYPDKNNEHNTNLLEQAEHKFDKAISELETLLPERRYAIHALVRAAFAIGRVREQLKS